MNVPIIWLKDYVNIENISISELTDKLSMIGHMLDKKFEVDGELVVDLELRFNRPDCYSILGIAREVAVSFDRELHVPSVKDYQTNRDKESLPIRFFSQTDSLKRFKYAKVKGVTVKDSPEWMKKYLSLYGISTINNIVDITNFVMIETGMPMHAFDASKLGGNVSIRNAVKGEVLETFDGSSVELTEEDLVFSYGNEILGMPGLIGGRNSGIAADTNEIILECAAYEYATIRKSMLRHNLFTEAAKRHSHDISPEECDYALARAIDFLAEYAGSEDFVVEYIDDIYPQKQTSISFVFDTYEVERLGGINIDLDTILNILKKLSFEINSIEQDRFINLTVPYFRTDVTQSADIVEEISRIYGYEKIPNRYLKSEVPKEIRLPILQLSEDIKDLMISLGFNELITVPMARYEDFVNMNDPLADSAVGILNPPTSEHTHMRTNIYVQLLYSLKRVVDRGDKEVNFFEIGKIYYQDKNSSEEFPYREITKLGAVYADITKKNNHEYLFYYLKGVLHSLLVNLGYTDIKYVKSDRTFFELSADVYVKDIFLGNMGIFSSSMLIKHFDINNLVVGFDLDLEKSAQIKRKTYSYEKYSQYPGTWLDMSVLVAKSVVADELIDEIRRFDHEYVRSVEVNDVYEYDEKKRSILLRIFYQAKDRTLTLDEVNALHIAIENLLISKYQVQIRGRENTSNTFNPLDDIENIVVGKIINVEKHPNADRLVVCTVDLGDKYVTIQPDIDKTNIVQIVTGARNILVGMENVLVPVALPGARLFSHKTGEIIEIKPTDLRGVMSYGMLCSAKELGLNLGQNDGILILNDGVVGTPLKSNLNFIK